MQRVNGPVRRSTRVYDSTACGRARTVKRAGGKTFHVVVWEWESEIEVRTFAFGDVAQWRQTKMQRSRHSLFQSPYILQMKVLLKTHKEEQQEEEVPKHATHRLPPREILFHRVPVFFSPSLLKEKWDLQFSWIPQFPVVKPQPAVLQHQVHVNDHVSFLILLKHN